MKAYSLRTLTLTLALSVLLTSAMTGAWLIYRSWTAQRELMDQQLVRLVQTLSDSVDRELSSGMRALQAIAHGLPEGLVPAQEALQRRAVALLSLGGELDAIALNDLRGKQIWNTRVPFGRHPAAGAPREFEHEREAITSMRPLVTDLYTSRSSGELIASYVVPVMLSGAPRLLVGAIGLGKLVERLEPLASKEGAVAALIDRSGRMVARTVPHADWLGKSVGGAWAEAFVDGMPAGLTRLVTLEGVDAYGAWARLQSSGWTLLIAVPAQPPNRTLLDGLLLQLAAAGVLASIGALGAHWLGRVLVRGAERLAREAEQMVVNRRIAQEPTGIVEFDTIQRGLAQAAALLREQDERARELERSKVDLLQKERAALQNAEAANRFKDESLGVLGHEMRSPLSAIANAAIALEHRVADDGRAAKLVMAVNRQARTLTRMVDDFLEVGRLIGARVVPDLRRTDMAAVVREAVEVLALSGATVGRRLDVRLEQTCVMGDFGRLQQVVTNLVTNALRYSPAERTIHISLRERRGDSPIAELRVTDEGMGINEPDLERIFGLFVRVDRRQQREGLGIGLSVVKRLVDLHGGQVRAESDGPGRGSTFIVTLPAVQADIQ